MTPFPIIIYNTNKSEAKQGQTPSVGYGRSYLLSSDCLNEELFIKPGFLFVFLTKQDPQ